MSFNSVSAYSLRDFIQCHSWLPNFYLQPGLHSRTVCQSTYKTPLGCLIGTSDLTCLKLTPPKPSSSYSIPQINPWQLYGSDHTGQIFWSHPDSTLSHTPSIWPISKSLVSLCKVHPEFDHSSPPPLSPPCPGHITSYPVLH